VSNLTEARQLRPPSKRTPETSGVNAL
jgi:hypothetical protein